MVWWKTISRHSKQRRGREESVEIKQKRLILKGEGADTTHTESDTHTYIWKYIDKKWFVRARNKFWALLSLHVNLWECTGADLLENNHIWACSRFWVCSLNFLQLFWQLLSTWDLKRMLAKHFWIASCNRSNPRQGHVFFKIHTRKKASSKLL